MPGQVPTILTEGSLRGQNQGNSDPNDFGAQIGQAMQQVGGQMMQATGVASQIINQRQELDNAQWVGQSVEQEKNYINKWMADPENNSKESFSDDLQQLLKQRVGEYEKSAPNARAKQMFRNEFSHFGISRYESALQTQAQTKITNTLTSFQDQIGSAIDGYRTSRDVPNVDANADLMNSINSISARIDQSLGKVAPTQARQLKDKLIVDATYATMDSSPDLAKKILDMGSIEGSRRHTIENQIDQARTARNMADVVVFDGVRKNWLTMVEEGKQRDKIALVQYQSIYSRDEAIAQKAKDDALIDIYNGSNDFVSKVSPLSGPAQLAELNKLAESVGTDPNKAFLNKKIVELASQRIIDNVKKMQRDPVGYMSQNIPAIKRLRDQLSTMDDKSPSFASTKQTLFDTVLRYQGPAPVGDKTIDQADDPAMYHNVPRTAVSLMTTDEATQQAAQINQGSPKDALKSILQVLQQYPDKYQAIAFNDLVKLPGDRGIRGEYWAAAINKTAPWVDDYLGVIQNASAIRKGATATEGEFEKALNGNVMWLQFARPIASDNFQRQSIVEDFRSGIMLYGMALAQQKGLSPDKAVKMATQRLLNEEMGIVDVNGKPTMIQRNPGDGTPLRTDDDIKDVGRRLKNALEFIDPKQLKLEDEYGRSLFPVLSMAGTDETKNASLRDAIRANGTFQTTPDGKAAVLYYDDGDNHFEMRDKDGRAFVISLSDLPKFERGPIVQGLYGFSVGTKTAGLESDPIAPKIKQTGYVPPSTNNAWFRELNDTQKMIYMGSGRNLYETNWPVMADWIRREKR